MAQQTPKNPEKHCTFVPNERTSTKPFHDTPMLNELEKGPWPSFVHGLKRLATVLPNSWMTTASPYFLSPENFILCAYSHLQETITPLTCCVNYPTPGTNTVLV